MEYEPNTVCNDTEEAERIQCSACGAELKEGQRFCPKCGAKAGEDAEKPKKKPNLGRIVVPVVLAVVLIIGSVLGFLLLRGKQVTEIFLNKTEVTVEEGETTNLICTINPSDAKNKTIVWRSSNPDVAEVSDEGAVKAKSIGVCAITAQSKNGKTDSCKVTVKEHIPDFKELFGKKTPANYFSISSDGKTMKIDSNPTEKDSDDFTWTDYTTMLEASDMVKEVNEKLGFSSGLIERMNSTTALQGMLSQETEHYSVSWTYHPNHGLEVFYEIKGK